MVFPLMLTSAFAAGLTGRANLRYSTSDSFEEGQKTATSDRFSQNYVLSYNKLITPILSYNLSFSTNLSDQSTTTEDVTRARYRRTASPAIDFFLDNPMFKLTTGLRRNEEWSTARLKDESRITSNFIYARMDLVTIDFPSLHVEVDRLTSYDHLPVRQTDSATTDYSASSAYQYQYGDLRNIFSLSVRRSVTETPIGVINKTEEDTFNGTYDFYFNRSFWSGKVGVTARYMGNYASQENRFFASQVGSVPFERTPLEGLHAVGTFIDPDVDELSTVGALVDDVDDIGITSIDIGQQQFHNIGLGLLTDENAVDRIFVYVNVDVTQDINLTNPANWRAFKSQTNPPLVVDGWEEIAIMGVTVSEVDTLNNVFRYEITFTQPHNANFFKVVNMETVDAIGLTSVLVTEIEAWGVQEIPETGVLTEKATSFIQGLNLGIRFKPADRLTLLLNYSLTRTDTNPESFFGSVGSIYESIFSKDVGQEGEQTSQVRRSYGSTAIWETMRFLTTTFRVTRSEFFDSLGLTDSSSNTYSVSFASSPLPTLNTNLSVLRSDSYRFSEKVSTRTAVLLSLNAKLYREVRMVTDMGVSESESHETGTVSDSRFITGAIDASITKKLFTSLNYGFEWTSGDDESASSKNGSLIVSYRFSRQLALSGNVRATQSGDDKTTSEGVSVSWIPVPVLQVNTSYQHKEASPGPDTTDTANGTVRWDITKFLDARVSYSISKSSKEIESESRSLLVSLNGRF